MFENFVLAVGYCMVFAGTVVAVFFMLGLCAGYVNEWASSAHKAAVNTYWWARWIRWHRIARIRKEIRRSKKGGSQCP